MSSSEELGTDGSEAKGSSSPNCDPEDASYPSDSSRPVSLQDDPASPLHTNSEMAARIRECDWAATPLGPIDDWPPELSSAVDLMLGAAEAISIYWGPDFRLLYNDAWRDFIGDKHPGALGSPAREVFPELWETIGPKLRAVREGRGATFEREQKLSLERDGTVEDTWFDYSFNPILRADGSVGGVLNIGTEVTERVEAKRTLREREARLDAFVTATSDVVYRMSPDWSKLHYLEGQGLVTDTTETKEEWLEEYIPEDERPRVLAAIDKAIETTSPFDLQHQVFKADGSRGWVHARAVPIRGDDGEVVEWFGTSTDITERRELQEDLVGASEKVRDDIGRRLHDILSSDLAAIALQADNLRHKIAEEAISRADAAEALGDLVEEVRAGAEKSRTLSHVLMPISLREERLASALETLCHKYQEIGAPAPSFEGDRTEPLPAREEAAVHLYRIAREALINAQRHADAEHIWVRLGREDGRLVLTVRDDGKGMAGSEGEGDGVGLRTMNHRADLIGATLSIGAAEEGGTTVRCALPLPEAQRE